MASVHQTLIGLAQMRGIFTHPDFVRDDAAGIADRRQEPGMIKGRGGSGRVAVPADPLVGLELVDLTFQSETKGRPAEHSVLRERSSTADNPHVLRIRIPLWPLGRVDDLLPDAFARRIDDEFVV